MSGYALSELAPAAALPRALHGLAARSPLTFARRALEVAWEAGSAAILDRLAPPPAGLTRLAPGAAAPSRSLALYLHWSPDGRVSAMVRRQVALWAAEGFGVVFVSNAAPPEADWAALAPLTVLRLARRNTGRDFGAWRDAAAEAVARFGEPEELLLANDSVLGPFRPLAPLVAAWRAGGEGVFGATESWGGGPHLQSYALLARGPRAVAALRAHLAAFRDSRSKWRVVQQGELGLARRLRAAGVRQAALFGYARLVAEVDAGTRAALGPRFADPAALARYPLNPCHHLWRVLVERMGFPWIKAELVRRNPGRLPGVEAWSSLVGPEDAALIRDHLALMQGR